MTVGRDLRVEGNVRRVVSCRDKERSIMSKGRGCLLNDMWLCPTVTLTILKTELGPSWTA